MREAKLRFATLLTMLIAAVAMATAQQNPARPGGGQRGGPPMPLRLTSTAFTDGAPLPPKFSCAAGADAVSPPLAWKNAPRDTVTFALILHDMEPRPRKGVDDILHWMVWNIPASANGFPEGVSSASTDLPDGSRQTNGNPGNGILGYRPPCPPQGVPVPHHYTFDLFALDEKVELPENPTRADLLKAMDGHIAGHSTLIALFNR